MRDKSAHLEFDYHYLRKKILEKSGIDLDAYKPRQMQRRIREISQKMGYSNLKQYWRFLEKNPLEFRKFLDYLAINWSEFFRDPDRFEELENSIIPKLLRKTPNLRIWSAACAGGEEPYSVAIILEEKYPQVTTRILATDIDEAALGKAKVGIYDKMVLRNVSPARLNRFFIPRQDKFEVREEIKRRVRLKKFNLLQDDFPKEFFWLILCRNVIIYFEEEIKERLIIKFHHALRRGGILFLGGTEKILNPQELGFKPVGNCFYQKI